MDDLSTSVPPSGIDVPDSLTAATDENGQALDSAVQMIPFPFCLTYQGSAWQQTIVVAAPSPEAASLTLSQLVQRLNAQAASMGYPPGYAGASGACG
jgi:hypothetical protein